MARPPVVTWLFAAAIVLYAWQVTGFLPTEESILPVAWSRAAWQEGDWVRLGTSILAHGGPVHLLGNLFALLSLGAALEPRLGPARYAALLLLAGVVGNLAHAATTDQPVVGASGSIFGLLGVLLVLAPTQGITLLFFPVPVAVAAAFYAAVVALVPAFSAGPVAHAAHLGGLAAGALLAAATDLRTAVRHAPGVGGIFAGAALVVVWLTTNDVLQVVPLWQTGGWQAALAYTWIPLVGVIGIGVSLGGLQWMASRSESRDGSDES